MPAPFTLTMQQMDVINLSLERAMAIAQVVADRNTPDGREPPTESVSVVMQILLDELESIAAILAAT